MGGFQHFKASKVFDSHSGYFLKNNLEEAAQILGNMKH